MKRRNHSKKQRSALRHGVAVVEMAVCLPVLTLITLATIESSAMIFLQQSLSIAAYEGARVAIVPESEEENARYQAELILESRDVQNPTVTVTPGNFNFMPAGTWVRVEASAPFADNSLAGGWLFNGKTLTSTVEMMKEH